MQPRCLGQKQRGQGLVGFIVAGVFVLVPTILAVNYMARVGDAKYKNLQAARYATWERTVWSGSSEKYNSKNDQALQAEITDRIFGAHLQPIQSTSVKGKTEGTESEASPELSRFDPMQIKYERDGEDRSLMLRNISAGGADTKSLNQLQVTSDDSVGSFGDDVMDLAASRLKLEGHGYYNSRVTLNINPTRILLDQLKTDANPEGVLNTHSHNVMLVGPWNARGSHDVERSVRRITPTDLLDNGLTDMITKALSVLQFKEFKGLDPGHVKPDVVPCQRLAGAGGLTCW